MAHQDLDNQSLIYLMELALVLVLVLEPVLVGLVLAVHCAVEFLLLQVC